MEHMVEWAKAGGRSGGLHNRQGLSQDPWASKILALGTEGYQLREIEQILTGGHKIYQSIRDKWELGSGNDTQWSSTDCERARDILWEFARDTIQALYMGSAGVPPMSNAEISAKIKQDYGFVYPLASIDQQLKIWRVPIRTVAPTRSTFIHHASLDCIRSFYKCLETTQLGEFEDQMGRFKMWASNIEVFSSSRSSFGNRLKHNCKTRNMVLQLLRALQMNLDYATKISNDENDYVEQPMSRSSSPSTDSSDSGISDTMRTRDDFPPRILEVLKEVNSIISSLQRLSMAIRYASKQARDVKIARHELKDQEDIDMQDELETHATWKIGFKFPNADKAICKNLVAGILLRQKRFLYLKSKRTEFVPQVFEISPELPPASSTEGPQVPVSVSALRVTRDAKTTLGVARSITTSRNTANAFDEKIHDIEAIDMPKRLVQSVRSVMQDDALDWPPPPRLTPGSMEIECPYCFDFLTETEISSPKLWKAHVKADLEPYSCYFDSCQDPIRTFSSFREWSSHMSNDHAPRVWLCTVKAHSSMRFFDERSSRKHMESQHGDTFGESQLNLLVRINSRPLARPLALCPLCGEFPEHLPTPELQDEKGLPDQLPRHVSGHLKELALLPLPPRQDISNSENADSAGDDNESRISLPDEPMFQDDVHHIQVVANAHQDLRQSEARVAPIYLMTRRYAWSKLKASFFIKPPPSSSQPMPQKITAGEVRNLTAFIRLRCRLDHEIWEGRHCTRAARFVVKEKMQRADAVLVKLRHLVEEWDHRECWETMEEWLKLKDVRRRIEMDGKREGAPWDDVKDSKLR